MARRSTTGQLCAALLALAALGAPAAGAVGPGLPRGYDVERVDSPNAGTADTFGFGVVNGGDLNGDGEDDFLTGQGTRILNDGTAAEDGEVVVVSGETGDVIRTIPAPEPDAGCSTAANAADRCAAFGFYITPIGRNSSTPAEFTDLGSCPGGNTDADAYCDAAAVGAPDGVPDFAASALFVDRPSAAAADGTAEDIGAVYVFDGATSTVLKRIDMPQADVDDQAGETERLIRQNPATQVRPWYGRSVINPAGLPPCGGNYGVPPAPPAQGTGCADLPIAVRRGDMDAGTRPDIVVGASAYKDEEADDQGAFGQNNPACDDTPAADTCIRSGRSYMYSGENVVGTAPATPLATPTWNLRNPLAQADDPNTLAINQLELFGHSVAPVGDVGACTAPGAPGTNCPPPNASATGDGRPEVVISAFRVDYPLTGPDHPQNFEIGANLMIDGATGRVLQTYSHPDPQPGSIFGFTTENWPAVGNMGLSANPDVYLPAPGQDTDEYRGEGIGFVMNGSTIVNANITDMLRFRDPSPTTSGSFGTAAAGVGDLVGDNRNEILLGAFAGHNPPQNDTVISDVHFFDPVTGDPLQSIRDPDQQPNSNFGVGVQPMGDLNEDGFLDFAVGAPRFDRSDALDAGRGYIFRSNNTAPVVVPPPPPPGDGATRAQYPGPAPTLANCPSGKTLVPGTNGNDRRTGSLGPDLMFGGTGDDVLDALSGDDCIDLGPGSDRGQGGAGNDLVLGGTGDDPAVDGSAGNDQLNGNGGNDRVNGGLGNDRMFGEIGNDRLFGGFGDDLLHGARGNDLISGSRGRDRLNGGAGRDAISAGSSGDRVAGDAGNDRINGNSGNDSIRGDSGSDRISGSSGRDRISAGSGNDRVSARDGQRDRVSCGRGRDRVVADRTDRVARDCERVRRS